MKKYNFLNVAMYVCVLIVLFSSCQTENNKQVKTKNKFPIRIVSGTVNVIITGYKETDNKISSLSTIFSNDENVKSRIDQYNKEIPDNTIKNTVNYREEKKEGDYIYYNIQDNEVITVNISIVNDDAVFECSSKLYYLNKDKTELSLIFTNGLY